MSKLNKVKCTKQSLTLMEKKRLLKEIDSELEKNVKNTSILSRTLNIPRTTLATILKNRKSIEAAAETEDYRFRVPNRRKNPQKGIGKYDALEKKLVIWMEEQGGRLCVSSRDIRKMASEISVNMGLESFTASNGWMDRFEKRLRKQETCNCASAEDTVGPSLAILPAIKSQDYLSYIIENHKGDASDSTDKPKLEQYKLVSSLLMTWQDLAEREGVQMTGSLLRDMSLALAAAIEAQHFTASPGWLNKYQKKRPPKKCKVCHKNNKLA